MASSCPACGQRLDRHATRCPSCGASSAALAVEALSSDPIVSIGRERRRGRGPLVAVAVIAALVGAAIVTGRSSDPAGRAARTTTTNARATSTTAASSTTVPRATSTAATTTTMAVTSRGGPLLPEPTGQSVYTVNTSGDVYRIDVDTGVITHTNLGRSFEGAGIVAVADGALVFEAASAFGGEDRITVYHVRADGSFVPLTVETPAMYLLAAPDVPGIWFVNQSRFGESSAALWTLDGGVRATVSLAGGADGPAFHPDGDGLVFVSPSGIYRARAGDIRRISQGSLIALSARYLVVNACDDRFQCTVTRTDRDTGRVESIGTLPAEVVTGYFGPTGAISPDGREVTVFSAANGADPAEAVYDLASNTVRATIPGASPAAPQVWTSTGWLAFFDNGSHVVFSRGYDMSQVDVPRRSTPLALAIGAVPAAPSGAGPSE